MNGGEFMYLDPGTGSLIIQLVVASIAIGGALIFSLRMKIKAFFKKFSKEEADG